MVPTPTSSAAGRNPVSGWIEAGVFVFVIGLLSLAYVVGHKLGAHPIAFVLYAMVVSATVLLTVTGPGPDALAIILTPQSWLIGAGTIGMEVFYYLLLQQVPPADGSVLLRVTIPVSMLVGWTLFARRPRPLAAVGGIVICAGVVPVVALVDTGNSTAVLGAAAGCVIAFTFRTFAAEFHPWNRAARTVIEKVRITGLVVLVTSVASVTLTGAAAGLVGLGALAPTPLVPTVAQMLHLPTILMGCLVGSVLLTAMSYLSFSCVVKITSENFAAVTAFSPVAALIVQLAGGALGLVPLFPVAPVLLAAMVVVVAGVFLILFAARKR